LLQPGEHLERYEVVEPLGHGGHAAVFLLRHRTLGSHHALKVLSLPRPDLRERLIQEGRIQANLSHPNIVPVTDVLDVRGTPALLMPYVDGPELGDWISREHPLSVDDVMAVFSAIVSAVGVAHQRGLVHRDLKPGNVLVAGRAGAWVPRVTDFGIAKILLEELAEHPELAGSARGLTRTGVGLGTPAYMAPEQVADAAAVDQRADVFALGCILHEMVTGRRLFRGSHPLHVAAEIASARPADLRRVPRELPPPLIAALCGCVEKDRQARIPDCTVLLSVLRGDTPWAHAPLPEPSSETTAEDPVQSPLGAVHPTIAPTGTPLAPLVAAPTPDAPLALQAPLLPPAPRPSRWGAPALFAGAALVLGVGLAMSRQSDPPTVEPAVDEVPPGLAARPTAPDEPVLEPPPPAAKPPAAKPPSEKALPEEGPPEPGPTPTKAVSPAPLPPSDGMLGLNSVPASTLFVDGKRVGHGGADLTLPPGTHKVRFHNDESGKEYTVDIDVPSDKKVDLCFNFDLNGPC